MVSKPDRQRSSDVGGIVPWIGEPWRILVGTIADHQRNARICEGQICSDADRRDSNEKRGQQSTRKIHTTPQLSNPCPKFVEMIDGRQRHPPSAIPDQESLRRFLEPFEHARDLNRRPPAARRPRRSIPIAGRSRAW